jgi:hypothetical protein
MLEMDNLDGIVVAVPGSETFKNAWATHFAGRTLINCFDNDKPGVKGKRHVYIRVNTVVNKYHHVVWPAELPAGFDMRDLYRMGGSGNMLLEMAEVYTPDGEAQPSDKPVQGSANRPNLSDGTRPTFDETVMVFKKYLHMSDDMVDALKIIFAVVYSNQLQGDPLWLHIVGPPGMGKTELLMSLSTSDACVVRSTVTPHSLVSGFPGSNGADPSLLPALYGHTFILKDFTEILQMPRGMKDEVYHILRGAYDGEVTKQYGNGIMRHYKGYFSMVTGVTQAIFAEQATSLGERFLMYHMVKGVGFSADDMIMAAIGNSGNEQEMKAEVGAAAEKFVGYTVDKDAIPSIPPEYVLKLVSLAQVVAMLRATVEKNFSGDPLYRPQHEAGTRLAKQLKKLMLSLAIVEGVEEVNEDIFRLVTRVALDTCVGFNLEIVQFIADHPNCLAVEVMEGLRIPMTTTREKLENMEMLGIVVREKDMEHNPGAVGPKPWRFSLTPNLCSHWRKAGLEKAKELVTPNPRMRLRFRKTQPPIE